MATPPETPVPPDLASGELFASFAYDVAPEIDLVLCERRLRATERLAIRARQRGLEYFAYRPAPLRVAVEAEPVAAGPFRTEPILEIVLYDFGALSVGYRIAIAGPFLDLLTLSDALYEQDALRDDSREQVARLGHVLEVGAGPVDIAPVVEDYFVYHFDSFATPVAPEELFTRYGPATAQLLRAERLPLSAQEVADAVGARIAFGPDDVAILDWNAAVLFGRDVEDLRTVLEFANVQLAEIRFLDRQLDDALERSYGLVSRRGWSWPVLLRSHRADLHRVARLQVDSAILFERVTNAVKLFGEEYLTRIYRLAAARFRLAEWDATILRKLQTLESIYGKVSDQAAARRMELLEWIIVVLIALSILLSWP